MRLDEDKIKKYCRRYGVTLSGLLKDAGVSRTAYYSLIRQDSLIPASVQKIASALRLTSFGIMTGTAHRIDEAMDILKEVEKICQDDPVLDPNEVRHTLLLLKKPPVERLRRALQRGKAGYIHE